jgi:hypothetical protein
MRMLRKYRPRRLRGAAAEDGDPIRPDETMSHSLPFVSSFDFLDLVRPVVLPAGRPLPDEIRPRVAFFVTWE